MSADAAKKQLANILVQTGKKLSDHVFEIRETGKVKHGEILAYFKTEYGLGHGNANLLALSVRQELEGSPTKPDDLLAAQYDGGKAHLFPLYSELASMCEALGDDVEKVVQKTGVAFRRNKLFALIQAPSSKRLQLGLNLPKDFNNELVQEAKGMCSHKVSITGVDELDDQIAVAVAAAYENC